MTSEDIQACILAMRRHSRRLSKSPEAARQFLINAGIETVDAPVRRRKKSISKKKSK